jgi:hypothetical protein
MTELTNGITNGVKTGITNGVHDDENSFLNDPEPIAIVGMGIFPVVKTTEHILTNCIDRMPFARRDFQYLGILGISRIEKVGST